MAGPRTSTAAAVAAEVAASVTLCCLPNTRCSSGGGRVSCHVVAGPGGCRALARSRLPFEDLGACEAPTKLPAWADVAGAFLWLPLAALQAAVLLWMILGVIYSMLTRVAIFRSFIQAHIGCIQNPLPRSTGFIVCMLYGQIAASLCTVALFILKTYNHNVSAVMVWTDATLGAFFFLDFLLSGSKNEFRLASLFGSALVDVLTVPGMLLPILWPSAADAVLHEEDRWVSLTFLRSVQAVLAYERLQAVRASRTAFDRTGEERSEIVRPLIRFLALTCCFTSLIFVCEVLGEPASFQDGRIATAMGDIDLFTIIYWVIETLSTVGYGDFSPKTLLSRAVTTVGMFAGVAFFTLQVGNILSIMSKQKSGTGMYRKTQRDHIVLVGGGVRHADEILLVAFVEELYHGTLKNQWPDLVVLCGTGGHLSQIRDMFDRSLDGQARDRVTYLVGSALNPADLERCRGDVARGIYIVADTTGHLSPLDEDKENIIRALSAIHRFPHTGMRLMLLMQDSMEKAVSMGIARNQCFSVNQLKNNLFWQSCRILGWSTMLSNLMVTTETQVQKEEMLSSPWLRDYLQGMGHEIYGLLAAEEFQDGSFRFLVQEAYRRQGVCIFAAQVDGHIVLAPLRQLKRVGRNVLFALAQDEDMLHGIALDSSKADWKDLFRRSRKSAPEACADPGGAASLGSKPGGGASLGSYPGISGEVASSAFSVPVDPSFSAPVGSRASGWGRAPSGSRPRSCTESGAVPRECSPVASWSGWPSSDSRAPGPIRARGRDASGTYAPLAQDAAEDEEALSGALGRDALEPASEGSDTREMSNEAEVCNAISHIVALHTETSQALPQEALRRMEQRAHRLRAGLGAFAVVLELTGSWEQLVPFLHQRRASYLPFLLPVVVLSPATPTLILDKVLTLANDESFAFVQGSPFWVPDLERSGVKECSMVVTLGQQMSQPWEGNGVSAELVSMLDVDVVLLHRMIQNLTGSTGNMIFEFKRTENMRLLPRRGAQQQAERTGPSGSKPRGAAAAASQPHPTAEEVFCDRRYASGQIFTTQVFASLFARTFHTPGAVEITQALMMPDTQAERAKGSRPNLAWQVHLNPEDYGLTYGELLQRLVTRSSHPVLPLGLYRMFGTSGGDGNSGYVWTNPPAETPLLQSDLLYVLGDRLFGKMAHASGLLPMSAGLPPAVA